MNTEMMVRFEVIDADRLASVEGGGVGVIMGSIILYGVVAGYTDEKCKMDKGRHWYCIKI